MNLNIAMCLLAACILGCSSDSDSAGAPPSSSAPAPPVPQIPADTGAVKGLDANTNGVRDDIDKLIADKYSNDPATAKAARLKALSLQAMMEATTREQAMAAADKISRASACVRETLPGADNQQLRVAMAHELEAATVNSAARQSAYLQANSLVGGAYFPEPTAPLCE